MEAARRVPSSPEPHGEGSNQSVHAFATEYGQTKRVERPAFIPLYIGSDGGTAAEQ
jgi:hypothetical protein